jgi:hypothetical protein
LEHFEGRLVAAPDVRDEGQYGHGSWDGMVGAGSGALLDDLLKETLGPLRMLIRERLLAQEVSTPADPGPVAEPFVQAEAFFEAPRLRGLVLTVLGIPRAAQRHTEKEERWCLPGDDTLGPIDVQCLAQSRHSPVPFSVIWATIPTLSSAIARVNGATSVAASMTSSHRRRPLAWS